uniref:MADF domain-containing protein n=1 Tax=Anopheles coluzzii TaxID=1518534 RepID=A0A6E8W3H3_ANOCL|nr:uncharacterized protein LOC120959516 [Anopheles coluzzii]
MNETMKRSRKKTIWMTEEETLNLISVIREHRCLWDRTYRINNQQPSREEAWETVSQTVGCSAYDLMEKWRSLQSSYRKCKMRCRTVGPDSVTWVYFPAMKFLDGPNDDEEQSSINPPKMRVVSKGPNNINPVRKLKLKMRRNLFPNSVTQRQPMQDNPPTALNKPEPPVDSVVKNEPAMDSPSPPAPPPDFAAAHNEIERLEECSARPPEPKQIPRNQTHHSISIQPHAVGEQDEDFFYVQGVAYLLKQFSAPVKRKLQIEIHDLIVKAQKRQYEQQFGDSFD